ncbi:hypothetical protein SCLCIDRAFT_967568 [Scleroderma citrinum Foug A]|uniref:Uncharacterized protein n=1 Tax=Scleroderma citrinum Foug A TaxID=1036808 RepID=A0A0C3DHV4_9AGAM|nr:hypothetical protein SCLCIDRAFT_967568 [Scleroderma citrinum Foug A]
MDAAVIVPRRGHGNSASVSTVTGSPTLGTVIAQSGTVTGEPAHQVMGENRLGHGHSHRPTQYVPLAQAPTRGHGQTQAPSHQSRQPHPPIHPQGQISEASHPYRGRTAHATVPRSAQRRGQYAAPVLSSSSAQSKAGTSSTVTTTGKRGRAPKRLRASLTGPAVGAGKSGPAGGGGGGDSDDDSDDDEADWDPAGDDGGGHAESSGHGGAGLSGGRKSVTSFYLFGYSLKTFSLTPLPYPFNGDWILGCNFTPLSNNRLATPTSTWCSLERRSSHYHPFWWVMLYLFAPPGYVVSYSCTRTKLGERLITDLRPGRFGYLTLITFFACLWS